MKTVMVADMKIQIDAERYVEVSIDGYVHYTVDNNYGADADGGRGTKRVEVEEVTNIQAYDADMSEVKLNPDQVEEAERILTRTFLEG